MRNWVIVGLIFTIAISSCNKNNNTPAAPPTNPVDTIANPSTNSPDTAYLRKTEVDYDYDATGTNITDSTMAFWTYDSKRRTVSNIGQTIIGNILYLDSTVYSYSSNQNTVSTTQYANSVFSATAKTVYYVNGLNLIDSAIAQNYIVLGAQNQKAVTYYYYDGNGNDTLETNYSVANGIQSLSTYVRRTYANNLLTTLIEFANNGDKVLMVTYSAGNIATFNNYDISSGLPYITNVYTHLSTLSGGYAGYDSGVNLAATDTQTGGFGFPSYVHDFSYVFDKSNRVATVTTTNSPGTLAAKTVYTYY